MIDHEEMIKSALEDISKLKSVSSEWPDEKALYPAIVVALASEINDDYRDDAPYLMEMEYYVRIFDTDKTKKRMRAVLEEADQRMAAIGYRRISRVEQNMPRVNQWICIYQTTIGG